MSKPKVHQFHSGTALGDAVTSSLFYIRDILAENGIASDIFAEHVDERLAEEVKPIADLDTNDDDLLIIHHSMGHEIEPFIRAIGCTKILLYHNITPPSFFPRESGFRHYAKVGLQMLSKYREMVSGAFADSEYNAAELVRRGYCDVEVVPLLRDFSSLRWRKHDPRPYYFETPRYQLLFVGRISPNKGQMHLVRFLAEHGDSFEYPLHLTLVGHSAHGEDYALALESQIERLGLKDRVEITGHVSDEVLYGHYRAADAYVSYSEHEGFGVPLLEAMAFDVPVIAFDTSAVGSTLGNAGTRLKTNEPDELAGVLHQLFEDPAARRAIARKQRERLNDFSRSVSAEKLLKVIAPHLPRGVRPTRPDVPAIVTSSRTYLIEGPCETSYSLAIVNRNLGLALDACADRHAYLLPCEGVPQYNFQPEYLERYPWIGPLLEPPPFDARASEISIRNMYPLRPAGMIGDFRLANYFWEESEIPPTMTRLLNRYLDGLIAPTTFCQRAFRNSGVRIPIAIGGCGVDHLAIGARSRSEVAGRRFRFGHVSSGMARKGVEELFAAYAMAFRAGENVELLVKTHHNVSNIVEELYRRAFVDRPNAPSVKIIFDDLDDVEMDRFYDLVDALVLPTRGEGYNLPAAEAMARGLPVLVTRYSGQMDFCNDENSWLIDYRFESSGSHVNKSGAIWARADAGDLAAKMRGLFENRENATMQNKVEAARGTGTDLTWMSVARRVDAFVDDLTRGRPQQTKMKLGWVTTWNTECGIATYSQFFTEHLPARWFDVTIFANQVHTQGIDSSNVQRLWTDRNGTLNRVVIAAIEQKLDAVVFQYNYGFHRLEDLARAVVELEDANVCVYVFFHKTQEAFIDGMTESIVDVAPALRQVTRLVVHSVDDVERLRSFGLVDNVVKLPHGAFRPNDVDAITMRSMLGLSAFRPVIATYGFLLPGKGLPEVILAFSTLVGKYPQAMLLMVNSLYGEHPLSRDELDRCRRLVTGLGLDDKVVIVPEFLEDRDAMSLLQAADVTVFAYQESGESASGAVRYGLSALRPVVTTPLPIFRDIAELTHQARSIRPLDLADAIAETIENANLRETLVGQQRAWLDVHDWDGVADRFSNMIIGLHEDRHGIKVMREPQDAKHVPARPSSTGTVEWHTDMQPEAFARMAYQRALGRAPTETEIAEVVYELRAETATRDDLFNRISTGRPTSSDKALVGSSKSMVKEISFTDLEEKSDEDFVCALYDQLLERPMNKGDGHGYVDALKDKSLSRSEIVREFLNSDEFLNNDRPIRVTSLPGT